MSAADEIWVVDKDMHLWKVASTLIEHFGDVLGHIDPDKIMFCRVMGSTGRWLGRIWKIPRQFGLLQLSADTDYDYVLAINDDLVTGIFPQPAKEVFAVLNQLLRVNPEGGPLRSPEIRDFTWMVEKFGYLWSVGKGNKQALKDVLDLFEEMGEQNAA